MTYAGTVLAQNPLAYWPLDEAAGNALDASGHGYVGVYTNAPTRQVAGLLLGDADTAALFASASSQHIATVGQLPAMSALSLSAVVKPTTDFDGLLVAASAAQAYLRRTAGGGVSFRYQDAVGNATYAVTGNLVPVGMRTHVAATVTPTGLASIYVNGLLVGSSQGAALGTVPSTYWAIGRYNGGLYADGVIDEPAVWDRALSAAEVLAQACAQRNVSASDPVLAMAPVGYWRLNEAPGAVTALDSSGYGRNAPLTGAPTYCGFTGEAMYGMEGAALRGARITGQADLAALTDFTISYWLKAHPQVNSSRFILSNSDTVVSMFGLSGKSMYGRVGGTADSYISDKVVGGSRDVFLGSEWRHIVVSVNAAGTRESLIDGLWQNVNNATAHTTVNLSALTIGARDSTGGGSGFRGLIRDVAIFPRALTTKEKIALSGRPTAYFMGDSYLQAAGGTNVGYFDRRLADRMGWGMLARDANGGSGYIAPGTNVQNYRHVARLGNLIALRPDIAVIEGGGNDWSQGATVLTFAAAVEDFYSQLRAALPALQLYVTGAHRMPQAYIDVLQATTLRYGGRFLDWGGDPVATPRLAGPHVLTGTGKEGTPKKDGNRDVLISADDVHPTSAGYELFGEMMAQQAAPAETGLFDGEGGSGRAIPVYDEELRRLGPVNYWRLDEASGAAALDDVTGLTAVIFGAPTVGAQGLLASFGRAVTFGGGTQTVYRDTTGFPDLSGRAPFTLACWVNVTPDATSRGLLTVVNASTLGVGLWSSNAQTYLRRHESPGNFDDVAGAALSAGTHFVAGTYDGSAMSLFIDGALAASPAPSTRPVATVARVNIGGNYSGSSSPVGTVDSPAIFGRALTAAEIAWLYAVGKGTT